MSRLKINLNGASYANQSLAAFRTFVFNFIAIKELDPNDFRVWFVVIGVAFSISAFARSGILEPFLLGVCSIRNVSKFLFAILLLTAPITSIIFFLTFQISFMSCILLTLGVKLLLIAELPKYFQYVNDGKKLFRIELLSTLSLASLPLLLTQFNQEWKFPLLIMFQLFLIPLFNILYLLPTALNQLTLMKGNAVEDIIALKRFSGIAFFSMIFSQASILIFQSVLLIDDLRILKSIETILSPFRSLSTQVWTRHLLRRDYELIGKRKIISGMFIFSFLAIPQLVGFLYFFSADPLGGGSLLLLYQAGMLLSLISFSPRIELMLRQQFSALVAISYWHLVLSSIYILGQGEKYSILILGILFNFGLVLNVFFSKLLTQSKPLNKEG